MKKRGFTLIELLAVIVILAIIALIATPAVLNIIEDSRKGAAESSARNIINAAKTYYMQSTMNNNTVESIDLSTDTLKYDGDQATKGIVNFENGKASGKMYVGGYCVEVAVDGKVESEKAEESECEITIPEVTYKTYYNNGDYVLFDPTTGAKCETSIGSTTGTNDGCMKWYAFLDSEDSSTVKLILDHNTTATVAWNSDKNKTTPDTVNAQLATDVTNWNEEIKSTARLISAEEINMMVPLVPFTYEETDELGFGLGTYVDVAEWDVANKNTWYYLHTGKHEMHKGNVGTNKYAWLFDNTTGCTTYGCNYETSEANGYWTSTYSPFVSLNNSAWHIAKTGIMSTYNINSANYLGVRPVITVQKSIF